MNDSNEQGRLLDHEYDGIQEFDNPLPGWWTWLWVASMIFSVGYVWWYHIGLGASVHQKYDVAVTRQIEKLLAQLGEVQADNATIIRFSHNDDWMPAMRGVFVGNCGQCHKGDGSGDIGPNLTDDQWKNVKEPADIYDVIANGVAGTAMAPWSDRLREPQMILLAAYVASLRGTSPEPAKAPEGERIPPWPPLESFPDADEAEAESPDDSA